MNVKQWIYGLALALQFFSAIPIRRTLPMNKRTVTAMFSALPLVGFGFGVVYAALAYTFTTYTSLSPFFIATMVVVAGIVITGGLHLDGWLDMSDAYFSYGTIEKRQQILDDPRTGAFGVISFVVLFSVKLAAVYEVLQQSAFFFSIIAIPVVARLAILLYFTTMTPAKEKGLGAYFKKETSAKRIQLAVGMYCVVLASIAIIYALYSILCMLVLLCVGVLFYRRWTKKQFGGMSGDLMGALCEGMEVLLWLSLLFFL